MNILFLSLIDFDSIEEHNIYTDLLRELKKRGHKLFIISPCERRTGKETQILDDNGVSILKLKIGNTQKTNILEKGISTVLIEPQMKMAIKTHFKNIRFDLVLYTTPPITLYRAVKYVKKRDNAKTYLMLKDIFPQNAVDLGMMSTNGLKSIIYKMFRKKEIKLYNVSDKIGCMSQANVDYILDHNSFINKDQIEVCPNSIEPIDKSITYDDRINIRNKYGIPNDKVIFVYGGNLGKPQGVDFVIECVRKAAVCPEAFFFIVGDGTEYGKIRTFCDDNNVSNVKLVNRIPKENYDDVVGACDVGLIFLDYRFTIPNFPSRLLGYQQAKIPILAVTDVSTDVGTVISDNGFGWFEESNNVNSVVETIVDICKIDNEERIRMGVTGYEYLLSHYSVTTQVDTILSGLI